jgi:hypothetical protein
MNDDAVPQAVVRMTFDIAKAAKTMSPDEARFLVDAYYIMQEDRKRSSNQVRALGESSEPNSVLVWLGQQSKILEDQIKRALDQYTQAHTMGSWMRQIVGIGPVISAGLLAHIDINRAPTVGHIWRYAGLDPTQKWLGAKGATALVAEALPLRAKITDEVISQLAASVALRPTRLREMATSEDGEISRESLIKALAKRPWNAALKTLCWKAGQSFMKFSGRDDCYYGGIYKQRKAYENARNDRGDNAALAAELLLKVGKGTEAHKHLSTGKLPPGQIDARARRYAVKLFLSHLWEEWYRLHHKAPPPLPYPIAFMGHAHKIESPVAAGH